MFKNKSFNVKMIDDPDTKTVFVPTRPHDYEKINAALKQHIITIGYVVGGIVIAKNVSWTLSLAASNAIRQIVDVKFPYQPPQY